jgi:uncharacterized protein YndB with AHSA1/START domain
MPNETEREVVLQRDMPFPLALVWAAMTDPRHVNEWFGPDGFHNERVSMDFRVGGAWTFDMVAPDGTRFPNRCVFKEIVPLMRMVYDQGDGERIWFENTITLQKTPKGTLITIRQLFPTQEERDHVVTTYGAIEGGEQHLAKLEAYVRQHLAVSVQTKESQ